MHVEKLNYNNPKANFVQLLNMNLLDRNIRIGYYISYRYFVNNFWERRYDKEKGARACNLICS
jgi:hypothetical protein